MAIDAGPVHDVNTDAAELLHKRGVIVTDIIRVDPDAILYRGSRGRAMTAWLGRDDCDQVTLAYEPGFPAYPSEGIVPCRSLAREAAQHDMDQA